MQGNTILFTIYQIMPNTKVQPKAIEPWTDGQVLKTNGSDVEWGEGAWGWVLTWTGVVYHEWPFSWSSIITLTHNLNVTEEDVNAGRYWFIAGVKENTYTQQVFNHVSWSYETPWLILRTSSNPSAQWDITRQENTCKINVISSFPTHISIVKNW